MKRRVSFRFQHAVLFLAGACSFLPATRAVSQPFIVEAGQARAEIVVSDRPARKTKLAARDLQTYVEKITGARLVITNTPTGRVPVTIYVGTSKYTDALSLSTNGLAHGAFRMASGKDYLALLGPDRDFVPMEPWTHAREDRFRALADWDAAHPGDYYGFPYDKLYLAYDEELDVWQQDDGGTMNAVCEFLRGLGVRWYFPGELGEIVPKTASIPLPSLDRTVTPDFPMRRFGYWRNDSENFLWNLRLGINFGQELMGLTQNCHGSKWVYMRDEVKTAHPEWYALWRGRRATDHSYSGAPCFSSKGLFNQHLQFAQMMFDVRNEPMLSLDACDGYGSICLCDLCRNQATLERGWDGSMSDYVWGYVNRLAGELYKSHPDRMTSGLSYGAYKLPPEHIDKLSPNLALIICQGRSRFHEAAERDKMYAQRRQWLEKLTSKELYIYDYYLQNCSRYSISDIPVYFPHLIAEDLRSLRGVSRGDMIEVYKHSRPEDFAWRALAVMHLNVYVTTRLWWDVDRDIDALLEEYYTLFYGPARNEMKQFIEYSEKNWPAMQTEVEPIGKALDLLAAASAAAGDTVYGKRVQLVAACVERMQERKAKLLVGRKDAPRALVAERKTSDLKIDGKLDDRFWEGVNAYDLKTLVKGDAPEAKTTFQVAWSDKSIVFGIRCEDSDMENLSVSTTNNDDPNIFLDDELEFLLETQTHVYYQIAVNAAGAIIDLDRQNNARNTRWASEAELAIYKGEGFWNLEIRFPTADLVEGGLDSLRNIEGTKPVMTAPWYFNLCRQRVRGKEQELSAFAPPGIQRFNVPDKFGKLVVE